ncbi:SEC12-like protein 1 isoform X1 [Zea mays]|uniref:SEC12-like protein 1 isoform X1 n=1 Tax=Zea mays TaxID=4577 RepID=UPI000C6C82AD|nr:SEC12-like protein 1 isoform X1 [Zea mays]|eukprot:XP_023156991.1 SEC12-like protein 1 isoform X1 [Zea mays]
MRMPVCPHHGVPRPTSTMCICHYVAHLLSSTTVAPLLAAMTARHVLALHRRLLRLMRAQLPSPVDSEFLVSTSIDGYARIWKIDDGAPLVNLTRSSDEKIECCRFSRDGMKPFMFCTVAKGSKVVTVVWNISDWERIGYKRLLGKPISTLSVSLDGKYLALGSHDGDFCAVSEKAATLRHLAFFLTSNLKLRLLILDLQSSLLIITPIFRQE